MSQVGLTEQEVALRRGRHGINALPESQSESVFKIFLRQFLSPLIYILVAAAVVSAFLSDIKDAVFIAVVLLVNGVVGTIQEYSAERAAAGLRSYERLLATLMRAILFRAIAWCSKRAGVCLRISGFRSRTV
jgi:Ca2+-transporting ATPase